MRGVSRFAPSTTGDAHPGTLLSALLSWLDGRVRQNRVMLRLEDIDRDRASDVFAGRLTEALAWLGLAFDDTVVQSERATAHAAALDQLAAAGVLYGCDCSRKDRQRRGRPSPDGGFAYDNRCRDRGLPPGGWREASKSGTVRARLPDTRVTLVDDGGLDLSQTPAIDMGDPVVVRRGGAIAYHLAAVVDDAAIEVSHVVRGRDLATAAATQIQLRTLLGKPHPRYRHHFLLLEPRGEKLAKLHGSVGVQALRERYTGEALCGILAHAAGLADSPAPTTPRALLATFSWDRVRTDDVALVWNGHALRIAQPNRREHAADKVPRFR